VTDPRSDPQARPSWTEAERLAALDRYAILDTPTEQTFDELVQLASEICGAPVAVVNFIADTRQWFKAETGIGVREMPLDLSICRHVLLEPGLTVVPDLRDDPRFDRNPLVEQDGGLRFYAGALVETPEGLPLGTVCVLDTKPRPDGLDGYQGRLLLALARQVASELELRRTGLEREAEIARLRAAEEELRRSETRFRSLFEQAAVGVAQMDLSGTWRLANRRLAEILGYDDPAELIGQRHATITHPDDLPEDLRIIAAAIAARQPIIRRQKRYLRRDGSPVWVVVTVSVVFDESGRPSHLVSVVEDITERRVAEERERAARDQLRAQAEEIEALYAAAPVGLTVLDRELRYLRVNDRLAEMNGVPAADHIGRTVGEVVPELGGQATATLRRVLGGEALYGMEFTGITPAQPGVLRTWRENWVPWRDGTGEILGITISAEEVTAEKVEERRQAFRLVLAERLRDLGDAKNMMDAASELLGRQLGVAQVGFGEVDAEAERVTVHRDWNDGSVASVVGTWRMKDFGPGFVRDMKLGQTVAIPDVRDDPRTYDPGVVATFAGIRTRSFVDVPLVRDGRLVAMLFVHHPEPRAWLADEVSLVEETCERLWSAVERARAEGLLRQSEARFRALFEQTPVNVMIFDPSGRALMANPAMLRSLDIPAGSALRYNVLEDPDTRANGTRDAVERVFRLGEVMRTPPLRHDSARRAGAGKTPWLETVGFPIRDEDGILREVVFLSQDVTDRVEAEERERLLAREVDHRAKNMLAVVQAVVELTRTDDMARFKVAVSGRIQSLARAHSLLAASRWEGVELGQLVSDELAAFDRPGLGRVRLEGPRLTLRPAAAQTLALVLHELTTNAVKYGGLSVEGGRAEVTWGLEGDRLWLSWKERGGPPVAAPARRGFGSKLIVQSVERQLGGEIQWDWDERGLSVRLTLPADQLAGVSASRPPVRAPALAAPPHPGALGGRRVLIVEDETLISLQVEKAVAELGGRVVGPAATVTEALRLLSEGPLDAAVLDLNLAGERSDGVARALREAGVPFVVSTGYAEGLDLPPELQGVRRLSKPVRAASLAEALSALVGPPA
jgi:PAS domain S-box-containing protein